MAEEVVDTKEKEDWMQKKWRPAMGWMYMIICTLDMGIFPILWSILQTVQHQTITQWQPLTLQGAGLFHLAMGAVLGIAAFGRTQEKIAGANNGGLQVPQQPAMVTTTTTQQQSYVPQTYSPAQYVAPAQIDPINTSIAVGFNGKKAPPAAPEPMI
jgi:hypothetical protein